MRTFILKVVIAAVVLTVVYRVGEELFRPAPTQPRIVTDVPAGVCPQKLGPDSIKCEVNAIRRANHLPILRTNLRLRKAARAHARDMVARRYFAHVSPEGRDVTYRAKAAGYLRGARDWALGEDIAWGQGGLETPAQIVDQWMHSPPHRAVIMNPRFREGGAGIARGTPQGPAGLTYVMDLAQASPKPSAGGWVDLSKP